jgi:hypothetical protein
MNLSLFYLLSIALRCDKLSDCLILAGPISTNSYLSIYERINDVHLLGVQCFASDSSCIYTKICQNISRFILRDAFLVVRGVRNLLELALPPSLVERFHIFATYVPLKVLHVVIIILMTFPYQLDLAWVKLYQSSASCPGMCCAHRPLIVRLLHYFGGTLILLLKTAYILLRLDFHQYGLLRVWVSDNRCILYMVILTKRC